jgi:hypothetical protein
MGQYRNETLGLVFDTGLGVYTSLPRRVHQTG